MTKLTDQDRRRLVAALIRVQRSEGLVEHRRATQSFTHILLSIPESRREVALQFAEGVESRMRQALRRALRDFALAEHKAMLIDSIPVAIWNHPEWKDYVQEAELDGLAYWKQFRDVKTLVEDWGIYLNVLESGE